MYASDHIELLIKIGLVKDINHRFIKWQWIKDTFAVLKNIFGLAKSLMTFRRRKLKIIQLAKELTDIQETMVNKEDSSFDLLKRFLIKRHK
jgi:hypothetical protein